VLAARAVANVGGYVYQAAGATFAAVSLGVAVFVLWLWQRDKLQAVLQAAVERPGGRRP
jgi:hypothetical protein